MIRCTYKILLLIKYILLIIIYSICYICQLLIKFSFEKFSYLENIHVFIAQMIFKNNKNDIFYEAI